MKRSILLLLFALSLQGATITDYQTVHFCTTASDGSEKMVLRTFRRGDSSYCLAVNTHTLQSTIEPALSGSKRRCRPSRYGRLLAQSIDTPVPLQNDGITHGNKGIALTTDLCPSSKQGFEDRLYTALDRHFTSPVPVTLFITGRWIERHPKAWQQLISWEQKGKLSITWGNHTYTHPYHPKLTLAHNFALSDGYDLRKDTLRLEKMLIERGVTPSVFFRFPGLVSNADTIQTIHDLGLITIGSDTWIAKGQKVKQGSIILLHGNKNEPKGVEMFLEILDRGEIERIDALDKVLP